MIVMKQRDVLIALGVMIGWMCSSAPELPRRAYFGIQMEPVTEDVQRVMKLPEAKGVLIQRVLPGSTAEAAGLNVGDIVLEINGIVVNTPAEAVRAVTSA